MLLVVATPFCAFSFPRSEAPLIRREYLPVLEICGASFLAVMRSMSFPMVFCIERIWYPFSWLWSFPGFGIGFRKLGRFWVPNFEANVQRAENPLGHRATRQFIGS